MRIISFQLVYVTSKIKSFTFRRSSTKHESNPSNGTEASDFKKRISLAFCYTSFSPVISSMLSIHSLEFVGIKQPRSLVTVTSYSF